ncbi:MAG: glycoside hydrolase family 92 protein [Bacteroidetes bacterium]|nr:glycoside hydrolase family 92 protein [Bacteroidota bacterium]
MKKRSLLFGLIGLVSISLFAQKPLHHNSKVDLVNPFVGTDGHGHTYPGAIAPFGMVQLSPDSRLEGWDGCSAYHYSDSIIYGFSHTHLSGTGCSDYGDFLFMPTTKDKNSKSFSESFSHKNEKASAGYYSVMLNSSPIFVELTATPRAGYHQYHYHGKDRNRNLMIDLKHRDFLMECDWKQIDSKTIIGMRRSKAWNENQVVYFAASFSETIKSIDYDSITKKIFISFGANMAEDTKIEAVVSLSSVSNDGALRNLRAEKSKTFAEAQLISKTLWEKELGKIDIEGGTLEQQRTFYTALYHTMITPNLYSDVDGQYQGMDGKTYTAKNYDRYSVFSLWDTYRTLHPLMTIIDQKRSLDYVNTALDIYKQNGILPVWELASFETNCMIGMHGISMIADAYMKGIKGDEALTLEAMINNASSEKRIENLKKYGITKPNLFGLNFFDKYGYISSEMEHESVSKTLEYAYNMYCVAQVAKSQGRMDIYKEFIEKAQYYKNLYNPNNKFIQPKENGRFLPNFDPKQIDQNYTEGNGWHYGFYVPQDIQGLTNLLGGDKYLIKHLDECFNSKEKTTGRNQADVTGLIGQYAQGNEPSHHTIYLYAYAGEAWKTQELSRRILNTLFSDKPDGICGNDDCGQMSAWYIMSSLGFYPVCPGSNEYVIGSPLFSKATINLENGKTFVINSPQGTVAPYVQSLKLNGKKYEKTFIVHNNIMEGGVLDFEMGEKPNKSFGKNKSNRPHSQINDNLITIVPYYEYEGTNTFIDKKEVKIKTINNKNNIRPIINYISRTAKGNEEPLITAASPAWTKGGTSVSANETMEITSIAKDKNSNFSKSISGTFYQIPKGRKVELFSKYDPQYTAGGAEGLIDLIRGSDKWRLGSWQGYNGCNFVAVVDLGEKQEIKRIGGNFIQETSPWIFMPSKVNYYISEDGKNFTLLETVVNPIDEKDISTITHTFFTSKPINARYIKVEAINRGTIPSWHISAGEKTWLFIDEIVIE